MRLLRVMRRAMFALSGTCVIGNASTGDRRTAVLTNPDKRQPAAIHQLVHVEPVDPQRLGCSGRCDGIAALTSTPPSGDLNTSVRKPGSALPEAPQPWPVGPRRHRDAPAPKSLHASGLPQATTRRAVKIRAGTWYRRHGSRPACRAIAGTLRAGGDHCDAATSRPPGVGLAGLEPATSSLSGMRSNRLSYRPATTRNSSAPLPCRPNHAVVTREGGSANVSSPSFARLGIIAATSTRRSRRGA